MRYRSPILLLAILIFSFTQAQAQKPDSAVRALGDSVKAVQQQTALLRDSVHAAKDSLRYLSASILSGLLPADSTSLDSARRNPKEYLYTNIITHDKNYGDLAHWRLYICIILMLLFLYGGLRMAYTTALLRNTSYTADHQPRLNVHERPFSFSRVQLFWWTLIILTCYTYFFAVTGVLVPVNITTIILLGTGMLVYAAGRVIDNQQIKKTPDGHRNQDVDATCQGFFKDILSDDNGISIHRFQAMVFNIVFGVAYAYFFISQLDLLHYPLIDFSEGQFALIGLSSATYLGLKVTENQSTTQASSVRNNATSNNNVSSMAPVPAAVVNPEQRDVVPNEGDAPAMG